MAFPSVPIPGGTSWLSLSEGQGWAGLASWASVAWQLPFLKLWGKEYPYEAKASERLGSPECPPSGPRTAESQQRRAYGLGQAGAAKMGTGQ